MPRIPSTNKLIIEQFPNQRDWIGPMFSVVNKFIADVISTINGAIEFEKNIQGQEFEFDFVAKASGASFPQGFQWTRVNQPKALSVVAAYENASPANNNTFASVIIVCAWKLTPENLVQITDAVKLSGNAAAVSDLTAGARYKIRVRVTP